MPQCRLIANADLSILRLKNQIAGFDDFMSDVDGNACVFFDIQD